MKKIFKYIIAAVIVAWIGYLVYNSVTKEQPKPDPFGMTDTSDEETEEIEEPEELSFNEVRKNVIELKEGIKNDSTIVFQLAANDSPASVEWRTQDHSTVVMWRSANNELYQLVAPVHPNWNPGPANTTLTFNNGKKLTILFEKSGEVVSIGKEEVQAALAEADASAQKAKVEKRQRSREELAARRAQINARRDALRNRKKN